MRFEPGKVYQSRSTALKFLCLADTEWINASRRTMYYMVLQSNDGSTRCSVSKWDYTSYDPPNYLEVKE